MYVSIKPIQLDLQKCIIWPKKLRKNKQDLNKACEDFNIRPKILNPPFKGR
jgi:hypothetical protein